MANLALTIDVTGGDIIEATGTDGIQTAFDAVEAYINARNAGSTAWDGGAFTAAISIAATSNQLVLGTTRTATITAPTPASTSRVYTFPDLTGDYSVVGTIGNQTITGIKTFSTQLIGAGTATNDSAAAGIIGEVMQANDSTDQNFPTSTQYGNTISLTLTAGDWDLSGHIVAEVNTATWSNVDFGLGTVTGNDATGLTRPTTLVRESFANTSTARTTISLQIPVRRISIASTTTYFAKVAATYSAGQPQYRSVLVARRVR